jgi:hypothetical protein
MTDGGIVCIEELCPPAITERRGQFGGAHHISEHDGRENAVGLGWYANAGEELPNLLDDGIRVASPWKVVLTWKIDVAGVRDLFGHPSSRPPIDHTVPVSVEHQRRHAQGRQHATYIDVEEHAEERSQAIGADAGAAVLLNGSLLCAPPAAAWGARDPLIDNGRCHVAARGADLLAIKCCRSGWRARGFHRRVSSSRSMPDRDPSITHRVTAWW